MDKHINKTLCGRFVQRFKSIINYIVYATLLLSLTANLQISSAHAAQSNESDNNPANEPGFEQLWDNLLPRLENIVELQEQQPHLPDSAWIGADKESNQEDINQLMDEALQLLGVNASQDYRQQMQALNRAISDMNSVIADARRNLVTAPKDAFWQKTRIDYEQIITQSQQQIEIYQRQALALKQQFAEQLRLAGLSISDEQLDFLLSTVIGDDLISMGLAFDHVKDIISQLEYLLVESGEDLVSARRYYGIYTVLLRVLVQMHQSLLDTVAHYQQELSQIDQKTRDLLAQSKKLHRSTERHRPVLDANIKAQRLTLQSAKLYRAYLADQAKEVARSQHALQHDLAVAHNTYETVKVSGELVQLMQSGQQMLEQLFSKQMPSMFSFQNLELKREFEKLTSRLQQEGL